ncbi:ATP-binding protein [bacterium AH-315-I18]|nr:ATP-binding protein [Phycisphaeraceae bacterium]MBN4061030.1 ATP-binding protein [bacterium AH-315-I18]
MTFDVSDSHIQMRVISQPQYLCAIRNMINIIGGKCGLSSTETDHAVLAVDEATTNIIRHGYKDAPDQFINVAIRPLNDTAGQGMEIIIDDQCKDVSPDQIQERDLSVLKPGGLGIHILYRIMDHVHFEQRPDMQGIRLTLRKYHKPQENGS